MWGVRGRSGRVGSVLAHGADRRVQPVSHAELDRLGRLVWVMYQWVHQLI
jgi:hypothetical protein